MSTLLQLVVVGVIVAIAALSVLRRLAPGLAWQWQARLAFVVERVPHLQRLGLLMRPRFRPSSGCASSCSSCKGCG